MDKKFLRLIEIVKTLRSPEGCPWDREQNLYSIKNDFLEEAFELVDALDKKDEANVREELGDVIFHVVFHSVMAEEEGRFDINSVLDEINEKLVRRHPHVFGDMKVNGSDEVSAQWDKIKAEEKSDKRKSILDDIPAKFPSMQRCLKIQQRVKKVGFDWDDVKDCMLKVDEEFSEFKEASAGGDKKEMEHEMGDLLFSIVNAARFMKIDPDEALRKANNRFIRRFNHIERRLEEMNSSCEEASLKEMEELWQEAKSNE